MKQEEIHQDENLIDNAKGHSCAWFAASHSRNRNIVDIISCKVIASCIILLSHVCFDFTPWMLISYVISNIKSMSKYKD